MPLRNIFTKLIGIAIFTYYASLQLHRSECMYTQQLVTSTQLRLFLRRVGDDLDSTSYKGYFIIYWNK